MPHVEIKPIASASSEMSACPQCSAGLVVLKIIPGRLGRGGCEYWTMRCKRCGSIHLEIVEPAGAPGLSAVPSASSRSGAVLPSADSRD